MKSTGPICIIKIVLRFLGTTQMDKICKHVGQHVSMPNIRRPVLPAMHGSNLKFIILKLE
jgi:hypothetical protein